MNKIFRNVALAAALVLGVFASYAYATSTAASAQGPQFVGPPSVPGLVFRTSNQISTCVGDGGFTNCLNSPQTISTATVQAIINPQNNTTLFNLDGGNGDQAVLVGQAANPADGGAYVPGLTSQTVVLCNLVNPVPTGTAAFGAVANGYGGTSCSAQVQAPGGDGGVVLVTCGTPWLGTDGGQVSCIRVN